MLRRLLQGDPGKRSRFRDFEGHLPPPAAWLFFPQSVASTLRWKLLRQRSVRPWLGYRAARRIASIVTTGTRVLEFGSGMSTIWFARRGAQVLSYEADPRWYAEVSEALSRVPGHQARIELQLPPYRADLLQGQSFDFALVDGADRDGAALAALAAVESGGHIYLDNADVPLPDHHQARAKLTGSGTVEWFTDFTPDHVFVSTGLLVRVTGRSRSGTS